MNEALPYRLLADLVLALHLAVVAFVVGGLAIVLIGNRRGWRWVNAPWFRLVHLLTIGFVAAEAWAGEVCPLTSLEMWLRARAHQGTYAEGFVEHWMQRMLYYDFPAWVFILGYTLFALAVAAAWWYFPPVSSRRRDRPKSETEKNR